MNDSRHPARFGGKVEFQDADGFVVDDDYLDSTIVVGAGSEGVFTGYRDIFNQNAAKIRRAVANVEMRLP